MVSIRCKMVVKSELDKLGLHYLKIELGEVEILEEDTTIPNYETSLKEIWEEVDAFISHIFAGDDNNNIMMALLYSFIELS